MNITAKYHYLWTIRHI